MGVGPRVVAAWDVVVGVCAVVVAGCAPVAGDSRVVVAIGGEAILVGGAARVLVTGRVSVAAVEPALDWPRPHPHPAHRTTRIAPFRALTVRRCPRLFGIAHSMGGVTDGAAPWTLS